MLCDLCKHDQATVHLTEIVNEQLTELHLCEACANQKGAQVESHFGLADLLSGLADVGKPPQELEETAADTCANCGMRYEEFRKIGRLGCSECYPAFKQSLGTLLKRIHGSPVHLGKSPMRGPRRPKTKIELHDLKRRLEHAIDSEDFEEAARLRDHIRRLEQQKEQTTKRKAR